MENEIMNLLARFTDRQRAMRRQHLINQYEAEGYDVRLAQEQLDAFNDLRRMRDVQSWLRRSLR